MYFRNWTMARAAIQSRQETSVSTARWKSGSGLSGPVIFEK
jgi:hypothetical protein